MRYVVVFIVALGLALGSACTPTQGRHLDEWGEDTMKKQEITGDNEQDELRWRRHLAADDPWGDDGNLLTDDPPMDAAAYQESDVPPLDFVGPPQPPSSWDNMQKGGTKFGKVMFSVLTVLVTLGMMAAPYLLMI